MNLTYDILKKFIYGGATLNGQSLNQIEVLHLGYFPCE